MLPLVDHGLQWPVSAVYVLNWGVEVDPVCAVCGANQAAATQRVSARAMSSSKFLQEVSGTPTMYYQVGPRVVQVAVPQVPVSQVPVHACLALLHLSGRGVRVLLTCPPVCPVIAAPPPRPQAGGDCGEVPQVCLRGGD